MNENEDPLDALLGSVRRPKKQVEPEDANAESEESSALDNLLGSARRRTQSARREVQDSDESESSLDDLLRASPRKKRRGSRNEESKPKGLNPVELLTLPRQQRDVINWLSRHQKSTIEAIAAEFEQYADQLDEILSNLKEAGYVHEALINGEIYYRVVFGGKVSRAGRGLPKDIWTRVDLGNIEFLKQTSLFQELSADEIEEVTNMLESRRYHRNEVVIWQGNATDTIYLIKNGIVGISRITSDDKQTKVISYLKQGDILGEYGILSERNRSATATASAMSEVDVLAIKRDNFLKLLQNYRSVAIAFSQMLIERLLSANESLSGQADEAKFSIILGTESGAGVTTIGSALAMKLVEATRRDAVYTEYPPSKDWHAAFDMMPGVEKSTRPGGYDIYAPQETANLPQSVRATMLMDKLAAQYPNVVIGLKGKPEALTPIMQRASQVVLIAPPSEETKQQLGELGGQIRQLIHPEKTTLFTIVNRNRPMPDYEDWQMSGFIDFDIPYLEEIPPIARLSEKNMPERLAKVASTLADRLGRTNQVSVYIPTTVDVDIEIDTSIYVKETMDFLGSIFGGATSNQAQGVWNSDDSGLVNETIHIVRSYVTESDMDKYLPDVLEYVEKLKAELRQEAMAVEVNQKLLLI